MRKNGWAMLPTGWSEIPEPKKKKKYSVPKVWKLNKGKTKEDYEKIFGRAI